MPNNNDGPIIIVDDDSDDREFLQEAWKDLEFSNELLFFRDGAGLIEYLRSGKPTPFLILCDVNIRDLDGFQLKAALLNEEVAHYKSIPFVYWSNVASESQIRKGYDLGGNGFFIKASSHDQLKESLREIVNYWKKSRVPEV